MVYINKLEPYRKKAGLTQLALAKATNTAKNHYQNVEYGKSKPNVYMAIQFANAISKALNKSVTVNDLFPLPTETSQE